MRLKYRGDCRERSPLPPTVRCERADAHDGDHVGHDEHGRLLTWGPTTWGPSLAARYLNDAVFHRLVDALAAQIREGVLAQRDVVQAAELLAAVPVPLCYDGPATPANERTAPDQWVTAEALGAAVSAGQAQRAGTHPPPRTTEPAFEPPGQAPRGETAEECKRAEAAESQVQALRIKLDEVHKAWDDENERRHDAEEQVQALQARCRCGRHAADEKGSGA